MIHSTLLRAEVTIDNTGLSEELPVVVTKDGVLIHQIRFLIRNRNNSASWKDRVVFSIRLFLDFSISNNKRFSTNIELFGAFASSLTEGTMDTKGNDPSTLYWRPRTASDSASILYLLTRYTDYLTEVLEYQHGLFNPKRNASECEKKLIWAAQKQRKKRSFLSHLWKLNDSNNDMVRAVRVKHKAVSVKIHDTIKAFPKEQIQALLFEGFSSKKGQVDPLSHLNLRDILITMLMHYGGLRVSETLHIYVHDIGFDKDSLTVKVFHPSQGRPPTSLFNTRKEYLLHQFGLFPRNELLSSKKYFAGWKSPLLTNSEDKFFIVHWFPPSVSSVFLKLWREYVKFQRVPPKCGAEHPYAFTSRIGSPYSIKTYRQSLKAATNRIGLDYGFAHATTPHSHRHRYGLNLAEGEASQMVIKTALHHKSIESQQVYTEPTAEMIRHELIEAERKIKGKPRNISDQQNVL